MPAPSPLRPFPTTPRPPPGPRSRAPPEQPPSCFAPARPGRKGRPRPTASAPPPGSPPPKPTMRMHGARAAPRNRTSSPGAPSNHAPACAPDPRTRHGRAKRPPPGRNPPGPSLVRALREAKGVAREARRTPPLPSEGAPARRPRRTHAHAIDVRRNPPSTRSASVPYTCARSPIASSAVARRMSNANAISSAHWGRMPANR